MKGTCKDCRFFDRPICRASPPQVLLSPSGETFSSWRETEPDDWCGKGEWSDAALERIAQEKAKAGWGPGGRLPEFCP